MFCYQCQETAGGRGCTIQGMCGKSARTAHLQDVLIYVTKGLSEVSSACRRKGTTVPDHVAHLIEDNLFITITNANFDDTMIEERIQKTAAVKEELLRFLMLLSGSLLMVLMTIRKLAYFPKKTKISGLFVSSLPMV
mgnify:CR=1 FL=1